MHWLVRRTAIPVTIEMTEWFAKSSVIDSVLRTANTSIVGILASCYDPAFIFYVIATIGT